jgi:hypothetical protein
MASIRRVFAGGFFVPFGFGAAVFLSGCGDDSKTTGTQLEMSPEVKAELDDMKSAQKEVRAERKAERAAQRKGR